jgi:hypothetical protein
MSCRVLLGYGEGAEQPVERSDGMPQRRAGAEPDTSGDVWVKVTGYTRKYFISRTDVSADGRIDDEAQLEIAGMIEATPPAQKKHLGAAMHISLLSAQNYSVEKQTVSAFFGSLTLRGSQRSALAYLPPKPFWELPVIISGGACWLCLGWNSMHRGFADLTSVFVGDEADLEQFGSTCVRKCEDAERSIEQVF